MSRQEDQTLLDSARLRRSELREAFLGMSSPKTTLWRMLVASLVLAALICVTCVGISWANESTALFSTTEGLR